MFSDMLELLPNISIHAPPRGATLTAEDVLSEIINFNSRPSARGDCSCFTAGNRIAISIHAPPRGATRAEPSLLFTPCHFNSRPSARGDKLYRGQNPFQYEFQFTPLREGRRDGRSVKAWRSLFQFTPLREGRLLPCSLPLSVLVFQFTPLREGRHARYKRIQQRQDFNSRPSARGDGTIKQARPGGYISIHAPPRGATVYLLFYNQSA